MSIVTAPAGICNLAFDLLRQKEQVVSLDTPDSELEGLASRWYDVTRRAILGAYSWNFARKRIALTLNGTSPAFGYGNAYNLPNNYLALLFIGDNYNYNYEKDYAVEGAQILIDNDDGATLNIAYIYDMTDIAKFDPLFTELLIAELAIRFANSITGLNKGMKSIIEWKKGLEIKARAKNGHDNPPKRREVSKIIAKRRLASSGGTSDGVHLFSQS